MPQNRFQNIVFTAMMVFVMAYAITLFHTALNRQGLRVGMLLTALMRMWIPYSFALVYELLVAKPLACRIAMRMAGAGSGPLPRIVAMALSMVTMMCPVMSLFAASVFGGFDATLPARWLVLLERTYPFALALQLLVAGPLVRYLFGRLFRGSED